MPYALYIDGEMHGYDYDSERIKDRQLNFSCQERNKDCSVEIKEISEKEVISYLADREFTRLKLSSDEHKKTIMQINFAWFVVLVLLLWRC